MTSAESADAVDSPLLAPPPKDLERDDRYNIESCDIKLVSSDNIVFLVHSYHLLSASAEFRSLLQTPLCSTSTSPGSSNPRTIELVDPDFETSTIVRVVLDLLHDQWLPDGCSDITLLTNLLAFLSKWSFTEAWIQLILHTLPDFTFKNFGESSKETRRQCRQALILSLRYDSMASIDHLLKTNAVCGWWRHDKFVSVEVFHPKELTVDDFKALGRRFAYALTQAYGQSSDAIKALHESNEEDDDEDDEDEEAFYYEAELVRINGEAAKSFSKALDQWDRKGKAGNRQKA